MGVVEGRLSADVFAVFDGRTLEIFGDQVYEGRVGDTIRLHVTQIADVDVRPVAGGPKGGLPSLTWVRHDGKAFPLCAIDQDFNEFTQQLIQSVQLSRTS